MFSFISGMTGSWGELVQAIWVGFRFDLRLSVLITLPIIWAFLIPHWNLLTVPILQKLSQIYLAIAVVGTVFFYGFDLGNYSYLGHRMDVSTLRLLENPIIAMEMAWESYPIVWIVLGLVGCTLAIFWWIQNGFLILLGQSQVQRFRDRATGFILGGLVVLFSFWGTFRQYQLLWSDAHFSKDPFIVAVALNPILYLNETRTFEFEDFDLSEAQKYYSLMADELGVDEPNLDEMNYVRTVSANSKSDHPNIVIVFLESVGFNRMERTGNPMGATPNLDRLASEGISFDRFYIPMVGTARSVFGMLTGIHDVANVETASSNPRIVDQYSLVNALDGYDKYYIMGGSASWRNVRSLIQNNIPDMKITEQEDMDYPRLDVWGISDHDLFQAAHDQFEALDKSNPFFAVVQTATNHRPYSIPDDVAGFEILDEDETDLVNAGFDSKEQYNAMRSLDHAVGEFMKNAASSTYGNNTIFLFFGDHGTSDPRANHMPPSDFELKLRSYQVPLIVYAPWKFKGGRIRNDVSQLVDLMPTVCGLAGVSYKNRTLGRDLFRDAIPSEPLAMIVNKKVAEQHIAVVGQDHYLSMQKDGSDVKLHELWSNEPWVDVKAKYPEITRSYSKRLKGIYETAKYMLYHNKN
ncbi:MAG: LTA synthase family protein [Candidatus Marinimicrobia bacterium]|jgi:phosphoglycerol transferase MdoB-like AlkP superfamily enzyme|nr:LTA synthase family protein [Candidatus Neomarinimicrobiota bacterium]